MTNFKKLAVLGTTAVALVATPAAAQQATNSDGEARARIVTPLSLTINGNDTLDFGTIVLGTGGAATVAIDAASGAVTTGGSCGTGAWVCSGAVADSVNYEVAGTADQDVNVVVDATATMTRVGGTETLSVSLTSDLSDTDADPELDTVLDGSGDASFNVGGSLSVADTTVDGEYAGTFSVTADYQ